MSTCTRFRLQKSLCFQLWYFSKYLFYIQLFCFIVPPYCFQTTINDNSFQFKSHLNQISHSCTVRSVYPQCYSPCSCLKRILYWNQSTNIRLLFQPENKQCEKILSVNMKIVWICCLLECSSFGPGSQRAS